MGIWLVVQFTLQHLMSEPQKVKSSGLNPEMRKQFNLMVDFVKSLRPMTGHATEIDKTSKGFFIRPKGSSSTTGTTGGARWL